MSFAFILLFTVVTAKKWTQSFWRWLYFHIEFIRCNTNKYFNFSLHFIENKT